MSNELSVVSVGDMEKMATAIAGSGLFGIKTIPQALSLMLISQAEGRHPALAARDYDIIQNRPAKKTEAMLRDFLCSDGKVEWHSLDDTMADATFSHPSGGKIRITWDIKRANAAGLGGRDMWKKYPRQMLRSRCVSEGVRTVCPMATSGMYVPEEMADIVKEKDITPITPTAGIAEYVPTDRQEELNAIAVDVSELISAGDISNAVASIESANLDSDSKIYLWTRFSSSERSALKKESKRQKDAATKAAMDAAVSKGKSTPISDAQKKRLEARIGELSLDRDNVKKYCADQYGVEHFSDLTQHDYNDLDLTLESMVGK